MIRLHELTIQAFRGIPDRISLNLSAPLTLIYAPNGSGKTTICEAAEWLLTGLVKRLESSGTDDEGEIRCRFSPESMPTVVAATLDVDGETIGLERKLAACRWRLGDAKWNRVGQADLLEKLAPSAVQEGVHRLHANPSRQTWLRGTRFLSGETLSTLLDSDGDSLTGRQRLFSDLLGVGHLLETERQLDGYLTEMGQYLRKQQARLDDKDAEIKDREGKLSQQVDETRQDRLAAALGYIRTAHELLQLEYVEPRRATQATALSITSTLRADLEGRRVQWNQQRQAELRLAADWPQRQALTQSVQKDQARLVTLSAEEATTNAAVTLANTQLQTTAADIAKHHDTIRTFEQRDRGLKDADAQAQPLIRRYLQTLGQSDLSRRTASAILDDAGTERTLAARLNNLRAVLVELPATQVQRQELEIRKSEYETALAAAPSPDAVAATREALEGAVAHVAALRVAYDRAAGPLEQLRHLSLTVVEVLGHDEQACPVCAHDWRSAAALRRALTSAAGATPASLVTLDQQLRDAQTLQTTLQDKVLRESQLLARAVEAERTYRQLEGMLAVFATKVRQAGLEDEAGPVRVGAERAVARLELTPALRTLQDETQATEKAIARVLPDATSILQLYLRLHPIVSEAIAGARSALQTSETQHRAATASVTTVAETARKLQTERDAITRRIQQNGSRVQVLHSAWQTVAGDCEWTDEALGEISTNLRTQFDSLQSAEQTIVQAEILLRELAAVQELETLRAERQPLVTERDRLNKYAEAALSIKQVYSDSQRKHIKQQMADFVRVISALFIRMQSNLVYDDVASGDEGTPLSWRAIAENFSLDPEATFSQGQRQDLALSIFLARARGLGGTFFLDEPVAHLDDLNRVALLDVFRAITLENTAGLSFMLTTANKPLVRHLLEKFARVASPEAVGGARSLSLIGIEGNPRSGVRIVQGPDLAAAL